VKSHNAPRPIPSEQKTYWSDTSRQNRELQCTRDWRLTGGGIIIVSPRHEDDQSSVFSSGTVSLVDALRRQYSYQK
jgi:hypothetical protein